MLLITDLELYVIIHWWLCKYIGKDLESPSRPK